MPEPAAVSPTVEVARIVDEAIKGGKGAAEEVLTRVVRELAKLFSVKVDEIALLQLSADNGMLKFLYPFKLRQVGTIPMTTTHSLAVRTARDKRPEMINNFPAHRHPTIFEAVSLESTTQEKHPIQKIMSAPLLLESKPVGVIQISRKGKSAAEAGPDFSIRDLTSLMTVASVVAKCMKQ
jgi:transcriptional regulator with GAF, ATPase, and Fis domain